MPKKKKKGKNSDANRSSIGSHQNNESQQSPTTATSGASKIVESSEDIQDLISLQLIDGSASSYMTTKGTKSLKFSPTIIIRDKDANQIDIVSGDKAFVFAIESNHETSKSSDVHTDKSNIAIKGLAIAKVNIIDDIDNPKSASKSPSKSTKMKYTFHPGTCYLYPPSLVNLFQNNFNEEKKQSYNETQKTPSTNTTATPSSTATTPKTSTSSSSSSSSSKFSFAKGGGGEHLISPSVERLSTPPSKKNLLTGKSKRLMIWIVPIESDLGDQLSSILCKTAKILTLTSDKQQEQKDDKNVWGQPDNHVKFTIDSPLQQRLVIAHTAGSFLSLGLQLSVSIQGRFNKFLVTDCESEVQNRHHEDNNSESSGSDLVKGLQQLSIQDYDRSLEKFLLSAVLAMSDEERRKLSLYVITHRTQVVIKGQTTFNTPKNESEPTPNDTAPIKPLVAGLDSTIEQVQSALETPLSKPELFYDSGIRPPKGILLHGPSGAGKTSVALQVGLYFESKGLYHIERIHCTVLQSQTAFVGQAERQLVQIFAAAQKIRPGKNGTIIILDDIHLICPRRQGNNVGADRLASTLLALLDGLEKYPGDVNRRLYPILVLATTTNPGILDTALRRPGRLDTEIEIALPDDEKTRRDILKFQLDRPAVSINFSDSEWLSLGRLAKGFTGADLKLAAKEAVRISFMSKKQEIDLHDITKAIRSIKPSAIKSVSVEVPRVPWSSIGGMEDVKIHLREAIELPLTHGASFQKYGIRPPRGVLLYGPPGCSKTLMARALATEGHMNFLAVKGPELLSKWLGESERALAALFRRARLASPSVIFFDEVDAIASKRSGGASGGGERLLSQLLTELDGINQSVNVGPGDGGRVVIVCATNRPDLLDSALMRPGRIDRMIYVGVPDETSRKQILQIGLRGKNCSNDIDISRLAINNISGGLSGAEIIAACRDAAVRAMERYEDSDGLYGDPVVNMDDLLSALSDMERQITSEILDFYASFRRLS